MTPLDPRKSAAAVYAAAGRSPLAGFTPSRPAGPASHAAGTPDGAAVARSRRPVPGDLHAESARECPARLTGNCMYPDLLVYQREAAEKREVEALDEAYRYRRLWEFAAAALVRAGYKPKGPDERRMMAFAHAMPGGLNLSGKTDGWLTFLPEPDATVAEGGAASGASRFGEVPAGREAAPSPGAAAPSTAATGAAAPPSRKTAGPGCNPSLPVWGADRPGSRA